MNRIIIIVVCLYLRMGATKLIQKDPPNSNLVISNPPLSKENPISPGFDPTFTVIYYRLI